MSKRKLLVFALMAAFVGGGIVLRDAMDAKSAVLWRIGMTAVDIGNLKRDNSISFNYNWIMPPGWGRTSDANVASCVPFSHENCCLCLKGDGATHEASFLNCESAEIQCKSFVALSSRDDKRGIKNFTQKYTIPASMSSDLDEALRLNQDPRAISLDIAVTRRGKIKPMQMYIDDVPWREWLSQQKKLRDNKIKN